MKNQQKLLSAVALCATIIVVLGCGGAGGADRPQTPRFLDQPLSTEEINNLTAGTAAYAVVDREVGVVFKPIKLGNRYTAGSDDFLTLRDSQRLFGPGDSGSPVITLDGRTIGALSGTFGGDNILITPIDRMLETVRSPSESVSSSAQNQLAWFATGFSDNSRERLKTAGFPIIDIEPARSTATTRQPVETSGELAPARSLAIVYIDGDILRLFGIGTATHALDEQTLLALGHMNDWLGKLDNPLPVKAARVVQWVVDPIFGGFKLAVPTGEVVGGLVVDRRAGVKIDRQAEINQLELVINAAERSTTHQISRLDNEMAFRDLITIAVGEVVVQMFDSTRVEDFTATLEVTVDGVVEVIDLGYFSWEYYGGAFGLGMLVQMAIAPQIGQTTKVVLTLSPIVE